MTGGRSSSGAWLVTGASGFLGRHLLHAIACRPHHPGILALVRNAAAWNAMEWPRSLPEVGLIAGAVEAIEQWKNDPRLGELSGIFHLAALVRHDREHAELVLRTNVQGTLNLVRLAAERRCRMILASTSGTVGCFHRAGQVPEEDAPYCEAEVRGWPYYRSKLEAERQARGLADQLGVELVIARPPVLLGPGDHRARSSQHVERLLAGKVPFVVRGGMHFADVRDVAEALVRMMELPDPRPIYHLPGTICSLQEFYGQVAELAGMPTRRVVVPYRIAWLLALLAQRLGLSRLPEPALIEMASHHWGLGSRYARTELGYQSRPGNETLQDTIEWLRGRDEAIG